MHSGLKTWLDKPEWVLEEIWPGPAQNSRNPELQDAPAVPMSHTLRLKGPNSHTLSLQDTKAPVHSHSKTKPEELKWAPAHL